MNSMNERPTHVDRALAIKFKERLIFLEFKLFITWLVAHGLLTKEGYLDLNSQVLLSHP